MSKFEETVQKLAHSPHRAALLGHVPNHLVKTAAVAGTSSALTLLHNVLGGESSHHSGAHKVLQTAVGAMMAGGAIGLGSLAFEKAKDHFMGNQDADKARHVESGKLQAQNAFKAQSLLNLTKAHEDTLQKIMQDDVINKADKTLMHSAFGTMKRFAPNLAADENAAKSFLREHAIYGTGPSYAALKNLADAEQAVARAGGVV